jgi:hypothetical protein
MTVSLCSPLNMTEKSISWNRKAVEQAKAQGFDNPLHAICPGCGTNLPLGFSVSLACWRLGRLALSL